MSVHSDYRGNLTPEEREDYERDLRFAYAREEYEERHRDEFEYEPAESEDEDDDT